MTGAQRAYFQLRLVELAYRQRPAGMKGEELARLRLRSEEVLRCIKSVPGEDVAFDARLTDMRRELRLAG